MEIFEALFQQDAQVVIPFLVGAAVIVNWVLRVVMGIVKIGIAVSLAFAIVSYLPHIQ